MKQGPFLVVLDIANTTSYRVSASAIKRVVEQTLVLCGKKGGRYEISIAFVGVSAMRALNRSWRKKDAVTDVLSFGFSEQKPMSKERFPASSLEHLGEIVLCPQYAKKQAFALGISFTENILTLVSHGIIHVCGIDHERSRREYKKTMAIQQEAVRTAKALK